MATFTKFDPRGFLVNERQRGGLRAKPAKVAKALQSEQDPSAAVVGLATLGASRAETQSFQEKPAARMASERVHVDIAEHDGSARRAWAKEVARLDPTRPPADVPPHRWSQFIDDCGLFLSAPWASYAVELGWRPHDLFGCDRIRPFSRIDRAGLLWFLHGHKLIALTGDTAVLETPRGARQTFYRRPVAAEDTLLAWELDE
jgi:hypothetical protein